MSVKYNHAFTFAFSLENSSPDGSETSADELRSALLNRLMNITDDEIIENVGLPFDTYEVVDEDHQ